MKTLDAEIMGPEGDQLLTDGTLPAWKAMQFLSACGFLYNWNSHEVLT